MWYKMTTVLIVLWLSVSGVCLAESQKGKSPVDDLPSHIKQVTFFGERADWSHDGIVFKNPRKLALSRAIATFLTLALAGLMVYWGYLYFIWGITKGERSRILQIPMVFSQSVFS